MNYAEMKVAEISQLPGIKDLPFKVRGLFALALQAEAKGDHEKAALQLEKAVAAEQETTS